MWWCVGVGLQRGCAPAGDWKGIEELRSAARASSCAATKSTSALDGQPCTHNGTSAWARRHALGNDAVVAACSDGAGATGQSGRGSAIYLCLATIARLVSSVIDDMATEQEPGQIEAQLL